MLVSEQIAQWLADKGVTHAFGIVGGGNVVLWDAITKLGKTQIVCVHHEQSAVMAATYFYRTSGRISAALVTTGAGSTNAVTGVMAAYMDSVPVLVLSGNEASKYMCSYPRVWGVQGYGSMEMVMDCTKWSNRADARYIEEQLDIAYRNAIGDRQGPVWLDIPKDIQGALV